MKEFKTTKSATANTHNIEYYNSKLNLGTGDYSDLDKKYYQKIKNLFESTYITESKNVIKVDFKKRKVISGVCKEVKNYINKAA